jgi:hypothetical protein
MLWLARSSDELEAIEEIYAADDRAAAIVGASFLETRVEAALRTKLIDDMKNQLLNSLLRDGGPIGSFATKVQLGFALGLYGPETIRDLLGGVSKIRNAFAHKIALKSFEAASIKSRCQNLKLIERFIYDVHTPKDQIQWVKGLTVQAEGRDALMAVPRQRYLATVALISTALDPEVVRARDPSQAQSKETATGLP